MFVSLECIIMDQLHDTISLSRIDADKARASPDRCDLSLSLLRLRRLVKLQPRSTIPVLEQEVSPTKIYPHF